MKKEKSLISRASQVMFAILIGGLIGSFFQSPVLAMGVTAVVSIPAVVDYNKPVGSLFTGLDITDLTSVLGDYCRENRDILVTNIILDDDDSDKFNVLEDCTDEVALPNLEIHDIVKPADPVNFNPTSNAIDFGARILKARGCKVDVLLVPQIMEKTWLGKKKKANDPYDVPFEEFIMQELIKKAKENIRLNAIFKGVYNAAGTTAGATMDGFDTILLAEIAANNPNIVPVTTGAITETNILASLLKVYDALGEAYKGVQTVCDLQPQYFDWYVRKAMPVLNPSVLMTGGVANFQFPVLKEVPLIGTNAVLRREPGKALNKPFYFTPKENLYKGVDSNVFNIDVQKFNRTIKILMDFKVGVQFGQTFGGSISSNIVV